MNRIRSRLTYANVVATMALFIAVGGATAFAAVQLKKNSVGTKQIKVGAITGAKVKEGTITGNKIDTATLGTVPSATNAATAVTAGTANVATVASTLLAPEKPHVVGEPGQPPIEEAGLDDEAILEGYETEGPSFYKDGEGMVHLQGTVRTKRGPGVTGGQDMAIFTLPPGYRPAKGKVVFFGSGDEWVAVAGTNANQEGADVSGKVLGEEDEIVQVNAVFRPES